MGLTPQVPEKNEGLLHLAQNKNTRNYKSKTAFAILIWVARAVFCRIFRDDALKIHFYVCFLAAFFASGVPLYADETKNTSSASKSSSPIISLSF
jgi:hypothetical protein